VIDRSRRRETEREERGKEVRIQLTAYMEVVEYFGFVHDLFLSALCLSSLCLSSSSTLLGVRLLFYFAFV
jgi:hypothetical protein